MPTSKVKKKQNRHSVPLPVLLDEIVELYFRLSDGRFAHSKVKQLYNRMVTIYNDRRGETVIKYLK